MRQWVQHWQPETHRERTTPDQNNDEDPRGQRKESRGCQFATEAALTVSGRTNESGKNAADRTPFPMAGSKMAITGIAAADNRHSRSNVASRGA